MLTLIPTDTCYGLAGELSSREDYHEIYRLKGRDFANRLALLVSDWDMLREYSEITDNQIEFLQGYPHPWSIILHKKENIALPEYLDVSQYTHMSFRVASECIPVDMRARLIYPLWLTSANLSGKPESKTLAEARGYFPEIVEGYDDGVCDRPPSDIFSIGGDGGLVYLRHNY